MSYAPEQPYASARAPVGADNVVATSQPLATQAGIDALRRGGNAIDAALAAAITLTVVEPNNNGVGSDAFCILWDGNEVVGLNASGRAPAGWTLDHFAGEASMPSLGWDAVTVPGAVSAWAALSKRYGALAFGDLFENAIRYARDGFMVGPKSAHYWQLLADYYGPSQTLRRTFCPRRRPASGFGARISRRRSRPSRPPKGRRCIAARWPMPSTPPPGKAGGAMRKSDLEAHEPDWVTPIKQAYRGVSLHEIPPNGQGLAAQIALGILAHLEPAPVDSVEWVHQQTEAMKLAIRAARDHFADPRAMRLAPEAFLAEGMLAAAAASIGPEASELPPAALPVGHDTVYLTTADASGMMVSFIQSNFLAFGSGIVIPGTGIAMQNRGSGFVLDPEHPNCVGPGKRPFHTIIPGFVSEDGAPRMSFGVMGGHMQHQGHVQMVTRMFDHGQNPQAASDAPRWHVLRELRTGTGGGLRAGRSGGPQGARSSRAFRRAREHLRWGATDSTHGRWLRRRRRTIVKRGTRRDSRVAS